MTTIAITGWPIVCQQDVVVSLSGQKLVKGCYVRVSTVDNSYLRIAGENVNDD